MTDYKVVTTGIEIFNSNVTGACKFVIFFVLKEAFPVYVDLDAVQVSSADSKISTYGF